MAWTYNPALLSSTPLYQVRFYVGDTDSTRPLAQDEEINFVLSTVSNVRLAAAVVCEAIAGKLAQDADARVGDVSESSSQKAEAFRKLAADLRRQAGRAALPVFGGVRQSQKDAVDADTDLVPPSFTIGQDEHPEVTDRGVPAWWSE